MRKNKQKLRVADTPIYGYWQALYMSFYSSQLYVDVGKRWQNFGFLYLFFVIALASIPFSARIIYDFQHDFNEQILLPISKLPLIYIQSGNVVFDKPMPYFIKNEKGDIVTIVDTTGKVTRINSDYPQLTMLITKNKIFFRAPKFALFFQEIEQTNPQEVIEQSLSKSSNEVFNGKTWIATNGVLKLRLLTELSLYPLAVMFIYGIYIILMLALSFIGQLFTQIIFKFKLPYQAATRLMIMASTIQIIVFFILLTTNTFFHGTGLLYMILLAIYFNFGVISFKRESMKMVRR